MYKNKGAKIGYECKPARINAFIERITFHNPANKGALLKDYVHTALDRKRPCLLTDFSVHAVNLASLSKAAGKGKLYAVSVRLNRLLSKPVFWKIQVKARRAHFQPMPDEYRTIQQ